MLWLYEARGLLNPQRTSGGTRRYSENDLDRLRDIASLLLALRMANSELQAEIDKLTLSPPSSPPSRTGATKPVKQRSR
ncbi:MAG: MerR family transcriptional regulator [Jatrophihabitantaceae bacterium]